MSSRLKDRARGIDLSGDDTQEEAAPEQRPAARTGSGLVIDSIVMGHQMAGELEELRGKVRDLEGRSSIQMLDPKVIRRSRWANRHEDSFKTKEFEELKTEIADAGRNIVPIKVRTAKADGFEYEVVYGHRRHQACLELGVPVAATVVEANDLELFQEMDRENRQREDLSPYEQGAMYKLALSAGLYESQRALAAACGVSHTYVQLTVRLASLPDFVISAFTSPVALQFRWLSQLEGRLKDDPEGMRADAEKAAGRSDAEVLKLLVNGSRTGDGKSAGEKLLRAGREIGSWKVLDGNGLKLEFKKGALSDEQLKEILEVVKRAV